MATISIVFTNKKLAEVEPLTPEKQVWADLISLAATFRIAFALFSLPY